MKLDVLIINGYAGSMTIGATAVGLPIRGSYEDSAFGLDVQRANFPDLDYREIPEEWPGNVASGESAPDLRRTVVLAHPPCSAFSRQTPKHRIGVESDAFACTKRVLSYAMGHRAAAIAVESVPQALEGAEEVHVSYARRHGYYLYRVLQNAVSFGVPQWRLRFWAVFLRQDAAPKTMRWSIPRPSHYVTIRDVLEDAEPGPVLPAVQRHFDRQKEALWLRLEMYPDAIDRLLRENVGRLHSVLAGELGMSVNEVRDRYCTPRGHDSWVLRMLDPDGFTPTLLLDSHWAYKGRPVSIAEYNALMGFPREYRFPGSELTHQRKYLSKGVCPPVATWVLRTIAAHINGYARDDGTQWAIPVSPGQIADFNLKRKDVEPCQQAA